MKVSQHSGGGRRPCAVAAFTMVEIALSIAVVAFAMVAIMGVLPTGLQVQRDNRQDTWVNQDGTFWLEALRSGAKGLDELTNYVDQITLINFQGIERDYVFGSGVPFRGTNTFTNGWQIVGLLSEPKVLNPLNLLRGSTNWAYVRALSGSALGAPEMSRFGPRDMAFSYRLTSEMFPFDPVSGTMTNFIGNFTPLDRLVRSNLFLKAVNLQSNFYELRLTLEWPLYVSQGLRQVGRNRKVFSTLVAGRLMLTNAGPLGPLYLVQPQDFLLVR